MVETGGHLKLLPTSILDIYKVFEHIDMLSIDMVAALHSFTYLAQMFGLWVTSGVK
jgi:hypothetical protein